MADERQGDDLVEVLRAAIRDSGLSNTEIEDQTGVDNSAISRFLRGERGLTLESAAKIAQFLGLKVSYPNPSAPDPPKPKGKLK
ncbi:MAG: helix-turn-helix transcriptional regulator [Gemmataceae bacterium]